MLNPKKLKENFTASKEMLLPETLTKPISKLISFLESFKEELNKLILDKPSLELMTITMMNPPFWNQPLTTLELN